MTSTYMIAEKAIEIVSLYVDVHDLCKEYRTDVVPDFTVESSEDDLEFERRLTQQRATFEGRSMSDISNGYLEMLSIHRKIAEHMLEYDTILFHGSAIAVDGVTYIFTARSGTGKSTHARLWRELLGDRALMVNDDKPLIRITDDGAMVYGTPWDGKHRLSTNTSVPLKAICLLERSSENHIKSIKVDEAYTTILNQTYRPKKANDVMHVLDLLDKLCSSVKLYRLGCNMELEAAELSYKKMKG